MMQSAISQGLSVGILLVPHRITFFMNNSKGKLMTYHITFSTQSPKFYTFIGVKYSFHTLGYLLRLAAMESPNSRVLGFLIFNQNNGYDDIQSS